MPQNSDHLTNISKSFEKLNNDPDFQRWADGLVSKVKSSDDYKEMVLEQEHLQFLMDHNLFYWKLDRFMLRREEIPLPAQIAQDRYLAHGARQNLLELWEKKDAREKRNLIEKDA